MAEGSTSTTGEGGAPYEHPQWIKDEADAISKQGFVDIGNGVGAVRALVPEAESTHAKIKKLMEEGVSEEEAKKRAVAEAVGEIEGKEKDYPDVAAYVRDEKKKQEEWKIVVDESTPVEVRALISRCLTAPGTFIVSLTQNDSGELYYLSGDGSIRCLGFHGGQGICRGFTAYGFVKKLLPSAGLGFKEAQDTMNADKLRTWICGVVEAKRKAKETVKTQKRAGEFEF